MMTHKQYLEAIPEFVEKHFPKNETAASGGAPTPGRGEATVLLTKFVLFVTESDE